MRYTASRKSALISQATPTARHSANTARPRIQVGVSRDIPAAYAVYAGHSFSLGGLRLIGMDAWFRAEVVYPSKGGHPPRH